MERRKYEKKSPYWNQFQETTHVALPQMEEKPFVSISAGDPYYTATSSLRHTAIASLAGRGSTSDSDRTGSRINAAAVTPTFDRFSAIRAGMLPFEYSRDCVSVREAILLCQKAYFNVAIFRRTIDLMAEMSNTETFLTGGTKKSRDFFNAWFKRIGLYKITEQYFREYFRSGNIFIYRIEGEFSSEDFSKMMQIYASENSSGNSIPINYILLNPHDVVSKAATSFSYGDYEKVLSQYELVRLKNPQTDEDKAFFNSLPQEAKDTIAKKAWARDGIRIKLSPESLIFSFYKRQNYEPFAVPFGYPVLDDINAKLELKKMDQAITRTVENVILLIKTGAPPDKGGINQQNVQALQNIFKSETTGRVLVTDWTTEGEFVIPDLNKVLGPEKYEILDKDIREGLQNILLGEEKYGNTQTKIKIFLEGLKEARQTYINEFLQPEIKRVAKALGMRSYPSIHMKEVSASDDTQQQRIIIRLIELGILSAEQGISAIQNGVLPDVENPEFNLSQEEYVKARKVGKYNPLSPVAVITAAPPPKDPNAAMKLAAAPSGASSKKKAKTLKQSGRPRDSKASVQDLQSSIYETENLRSFIKDNLREKFEVETLSLEQEEIVEQLAQKICTAAEIGDWQNLASACISDNSKMLSLYPLQGVLDSMEENDLPEYEAALLYHSCKI